MGLESIFMAGLQMRVVDGDTVDLIAKNTYVTINRDWLDEYFGEKYSDDESVLIENDELTVELYPKDFRRIYYAMEHFQG